MDNKSHDLTSTKPKVTGSNPVGRTLDPAWALAKLRASNRTPHKKVQSSGQASTILTPVVADANSVDEVLRAGQIDKKRHQGRFAQMDQITAQQIARDFFGTGTDRFTGPGDAHDAAAHMVRGLMALVPQPGAWAVATPDSQTPAVAMPTVFLVVAGGLWRIVPGEGRLAVDRTRLEGANLGISDQEEYDHGAHRVTRTIVLTCVSDDDEPIVLRYNWLRDVEGEEARAPLFAVVRALGTELGWGIESYPADLRRN